ncbi:plasmid pRiA4b ORF-3 family protein [Thalassoporum mexicanum PCC 7367]|uniref:plasmid pRiA4b ORF-3 family protein n=1 Tax=Thalassoporum mexicanum TaxID=3457544 RepID=UPI00029F9946|nr:plasmid pRiA4b ORF-3 family protein [Pseudanabaena sp. PCC 7367]AFY68785.1 plasmid pRiA4b ORF-3 family protein [Pseudanabaena sp. PCC 7367]
MAPRRVKSSKQVYQLKISLDDIRPPIWRRVQVLDNITLRNLHWVIQLAMGWTNSHLHAFEVGRYPQEQRYGMVIDAYDTELGLKDDKKVYLSKIVDGEKFKFFYQYDFGDGWDHIILVEKILPIDPEVSYPICIKGKRACPPEDCGGVWGYMDLIDILQDPEHPDHESMLEWVDDGFDPNRFDLDAANKLLQQIDKFMSMYDR